MSTPDYSQVLNCTYGVVGLSLLSVEVKQDPVVKEGLGRVATNVTVKAECELRRQTPADLMTALQTILPALEIDGVDFIVTGLGGVVQFEMLAALSADYGPHVGYTMKDSPDSPLCKLFTLELKSQATWPSGNNQSATDTFKLHIDTRADALITVTRTGEIHGLNTPNFFLTVVLPLFQASYPYPQWVITSSYDTSQDVPRSGVSNFVLQNKLTYQAVARQDFGPLPNIPATGGHLVAGAVDGEISTKVDRDEQYRKVTTIDFDLLVVGSVSALMSKLRPNKPNVLIFRESLTVTSIREQRCRGNFTMLESADPTMLLLNYQQNVRLIPGKKSYEVKTYNGAAPVLVASAETIPRITQSGSCRAVGKFRKAPTPLFHTNLELPEITYTDVNAVEKETQWTFVMYPSDGGNTGSLGDPIASDAPDNAYIVPDDFDVTLISRANLGTGADRYLPPSAPA